MDFVERWFGISPDHGDGTFEVLVLVAIVAAMGIVWFRRPLARACSQLISRLRRPMHR